MKYRIRRCRDGLYYLQQKLAPGLDGGIWRRVGEGTKERNIAEVVRARAAGKLV